MRGHLGQVELPVHQFLPVCICPSSAISLLILTETAEVSSQSSPLEAEQAQLPQPFLIRDAPVPCSPLLPLLYPPQELHVSLVALPQNLLGQLQPGMFVHPVNLKLQLPKSRPHDDTELGKSPVATAIELLGTTTNAHQNNSHKKRRKNAPE